jgi:hypothetical protein
LRSARGTTLPRAAHVSHRGIAMSHDPDAFKRVFLAYVAEYGGKCTKPSQISSMYADAWVHALMETMPIKHTGETKGLVSAVQRHG